MKKRLERARQELLDRLVRRGVVDGAQDADKLLPVGIGLGEVPIRAGQADALANAAGQFAAGLGVPQSMSGAVALAQSYLTSLVLGSVTKVGTLVFAVFCAVATGAVVYRDAAADNHRGQMEEPAVVLPQEGPAAGGRAVAEEAEILSQQPSRVVPDDGGPRERDLAKWILEAGGAVSVRRENQPGLVEVLRVDRLPAGRFRVVGARIDGIKHLTPDDLSRLAGLEKLEKLEARDIALDAAGVMALARCPRLNFLCMAFNPLNDDDLLAVAQLPAVESLGLRGSRVTDDGLARLEPLARLRQLNLSETLIRGPGLARLDKMTQLRALYLRKTAIPGEGLRHLPPLPALDELWLPEGMLETLDAGVPTLGQFVALKAVVVCSDGVNETQRKQLRASLPRMKKQAPGRVLVLWKVRQTAEQLARLGALFPGYQVRYHP